VEILNFADVITGDARAAYDLEFDNEDQTIMIDFRDAAAVVPAIASNCCRFSSAALQSMLGVSEGILDKGALPWSLIKLYYAAFYAGHALIGMLGQSCSYLERRHTRRLGEMGDLLGRVPSFGVDSGLYHCVITDRETGLRLKRARGSVGGAHETFWQVLGDIIDKAGENVLQGPLIPTEATAVFVKMEACKKILRFNGGRAYNWLSEVRNILQYRNGLGVWMPVQISQRQKENLSRIAGQWIRDPMEVDLPTALRGDLSEFVAACVFVVALCRAMLVRISERSSAGGRSFVRYGPMALFREGEIRW
jgi:hypothetical protein